MDKRLGVMICSALLLCVLKFVPKSLVEVFGDCDTFVVYAQGQSAFGIGTELDRAQARQAVLESCDGITVQTDLTLLQALQRLSVSNYEVMRLDEIMIVCGYSPQLKGGVLLDGRLVNVQLAFCNGKTIIGSPLIFGSY